MRTDTSLYLSGSDSKKLEEISQKVNLSKSVIIRRIINEMHKLTVDHERISFAVSEHRSGQAVGIILIPIEVWAGKFEDEKLGEVIKNE